MISSFAGQSMNHNILSFKGKKKKKKKIKTKLIYKNPN